MQRNDLFFSLLSFLQIFLFVQLLSAVRQILFIGISADSVLANIRLALAGSAFFLLFKSFASLLHYMKIPVETKPSGLLQTVATQSLFVLVLLSIVVLSSV